jgi:hypothetical protein
MTMGVLAESSLEQAWAAEESRNQSSLTRTIAVVNRGIAR